MKQKPTLPPAPHNDHTMLCELHCWVAEIRALVHDIFKWGKRGALTPRQIDDLQAITRDIRSVTTRLNAADRET